MGNKDKETLIGSFRSTEIYNTTAILEKLSQYLLQYEGHDNASGFTIKLKNLNKFEKDIRKLVKETEKREKILEYDIEIPIEKLSLQDFNEIEKLYPYQDILLVDPNSNILVSLNNIEVRHSNVTLVSLETAINEQKTVIVDFHYPPDSNSVHLDVIAPLLLQEKGPQQTIGAAIFYIDPSDYLYPLIQSWPMPNDTAETLLVA